MRKLVSICKSSYTKNKLHSLFVFKFSKFQNFPEFFIIIQKKKMIKIENIHDFNPIKSNKELSTL